MKTITLFLLLAVAGQALSQNSTFYELPDLGVNQEAGDCRNAASLFSIAQHDLNRLRGIVLDIEDSLSILDEVTPLVGQICDRHTQIQGMNFLQTNVRAKSKTKMFSQIRKLKELPENLAKDSVVTQMISSKLDVIINQITVASAQSNEQHIAQTCTELRAAIQDLKDYLNWAANQINSQWINGYLPTRLSDMLAKMNQQWTCALVFIPKSQATITYSRIDNSLSILNNLMDPNVQGRGWNAGWSAPQWIQIAFKQPTYVDSLRLDADIYPDGNIQASIVADYGLSTQRTIASINQYLSYHQILSFPVKLSLTNLRITTTYISSQSWVAWEKILFYTGETNCQCI